MNNYINILLISGSSILAGIINYAYHPLMLRYLSLEDFGTFGSIVGIFNLLSILLMGLDSFFTKNYSKKLYDIPKLKFEFYAAFLYLFMLGASCYLLFLCFVPLLARFLNINDFSLLYITALIIIISFIGVNIGALLKGMRVFKVIAIQQILGPIIKLSLGIIFLFLGFGVAGALIGFVTAGFIPLLIGYFYIYKKLSHSPSIGDKNSIKGEFLNSKSEIYHFFLMSFVFAFFMNIDVILVKNLFSAELSGVYAAVSILGKFLIFLLLSIETVYFGQIMEYERRETPRVLLKNPLILVTLTIFGAIVFNIFFGRYILGFLKTELITYTHLYMLTLVYYSLIAYVSFCIKILVGWKEYSLVYILGFYGIICVSSFYIFNIESLQSYIYIFIILGFISALTSLGMLGYKIQQK